MYGAGKEINANTWQSKWLAQESKHWAGAAVGVQHAVSPVWDGHLSAHSFVQPPAMARAVMNIS